MKIITTLAVAVGLVGLAACKQTPTENNAEQIEANAENTTMMNETNVGNAAENMEANAETNAGTNVTNTASNATNAY